MFVDWHLQVFWTVLDQNGENSDILREKNKTKIEKFKNAIRAYQNLLR